MKTLVTCLNCNFLADELTVHRSIDPSIPPSLPPSIYPSIIYRKSCLFPFIVPNASKFLLLSVLTLIQTICSKFSAKQLPQIAKLLLPVDVRRSKTSLHKYPVRPIETTRRGFQTIFQFPNRYNSKLTNYSFFQMHPANLSLQFQSLEQQSRLQSSRREDWAGHSRDQVTDLLEHTV